MLSFLAKKMHFVASGLEGLSQLICQLVGLSGREESRALCEGNNKVSSVAAQRGRLKEPQGTTSNKDNDNEFIRRVFACFQYLLSF